MTNREKYAEQILDIACGGDYVAVRKKDMKPDWCKNIECHECYFYVSNENCYDTRENCYDTRKEWCESEYIEPPIDWSKIPVDTPILVKNIENEEWRHRHFAEFNDGIVYAWEGGKTSWSLLSLGKVDWKYAKLAEESNG